MTEVCDGAHLGYLLWKKKGKGKEILYFRQFSAALMAAGDKKLINSGEFSYILQ